MSSWSGSASRHRLTAAILLLLGIGLAVSVYSRQYVLFVILAVMTAVFVVHQRMLRKETEHMHRQRAEELERLAREKQFNYLNRRANDAIVLVDHDSGSRIIDVNERTEKTYGWSREELLTMSLPDLLPLGSDVTMHTRLQHLRAEHSALFEAVHRRRDGTHFPVEVSISLIEMEGRHISEGIIRDISERKQVELAFRENEERYRMLIELSPDLFAIHRSDKFVYLNRGGAALLGAATPEELIGKPVTDFVHPDDQARVRGHRRQSSGGPVPTEFREGKFVRLCGTVMDVEFASVPLHLQGDPAMIVIARDLTSRKQAERAQLESEQRYRRLVESVTDYIYTVDVSGGRAIATRHGPGCVTVTGYTTEDYQADPGLWYRMVYDEDKAFVVEQANSILSGNQTLPFEHRIIHKDGSLRWVRNTPVPRFAADGTLTAYDGMISDITQLKLLENQLRQAQKMEAVGQLAGGIAHDFNNILTAIIGYANLLLMKMPADNAGRTFVGQILSSAERAAHLTHSLLAFSRKQIINLRPVKVSEVIQRVETLLRRVIGEDIELRSRTEAPDLFILADGMQIEQCLMNLATNSRDAMPEGGVFSIEIAPVELGEEFVRTHSYAKPGTYALICVSDTGAGMDETVRSRIFEPFFTTKETGKGTGLGLAMVYGIVKQHNGYIHVYSEPGHGTTFKIYLPVTLTPDDKQEHLQEDGMRGGRETVLLAEDDVMVRELSGNVLRNFGYTVIEAVDGEDAVRKFTENRERVDILVLDIIMPKKSGNDVYREISGMRPGIRALFTSGYTADMVQRKGVLETGMDFLFKPSAPADLLKKVREVLDRK